MNCVPSSLSPSLGGSYDQIYSHHVPYSYGLFEMLKHASTNF